MIPRIKETHRTTHTVVVELKVNMLKKIIRETVIQESVDTTNTVILINLAPNNTRNNPMMIITAPNRVLYFVKKY